MKEKKQEQQESLSKGFEIRRGNCSVPATVHGPAVITQNNIVTKVCILLFLFIINSVC